MRRWLPAVVALSLAGACSGDAEAPAPTPRRSSAVIVASFDFRESRLVAEIYALALEEAGVSVDRQFGLGPRELVVPALRQGLIDVVPEYAGSALDAADPDADLDRSDVGAVIAALADAVAPWEVVVLEPSDASNRNELVVTADVAAERGLVAISDLAPIAGSLTGGGPPECPERPRCLPGLAETYDVRFGEFVPLAGEDLVRRALVDGVIEVGVLFTTDASLAGDDLVPLVDDRHLQPVDPIVPLAREQVVDRDVEAALDAVSERLTTASLRFLNWRVAQAGTEVEDEARAWLIRQGLVRRG